VRRTISRNKAYLFLQSIAQKCTSKTGTMKHSSKGNNEIDSYEKERVKESQIPPLYQS
jgi:hypothetical protein